MGRSERRERRKWERRNRRVDKITGKGNLELYTQMEGGGETNRERERESEGDASEGGTEREEGMGREGQQVEKKNEASMPLSRHHPESPLTALDSDVLMLICRKLPLSALGSLSKASHAFRQFVHSEAHLVWVGETGYQERSLVMEQLVLCVANGQRAFLLQLFRERAWLDEFACKPESLLIACALGDEEWVRLLLRHKPNRPILWKELTLAVRRAGVRMPGCLNHILQNALPPLIAAAYSGSELCLRTLIEVGAAAGVDVKTNGGMALRTAAGRGHARCVRALIEVNVELNDSSSRGGTALIAACEGGHVACVLALLEACAAIDARFGSRQSLLKACHAKTLMFDETALMLACRTGNHRCAQALIRMGAPVNDSTGANETAIFMACAAGHEACVQTLVTLGGADVNHLTTVGWTPLMYACDSGHEKCARILIKAGADLYRQTSTGTTALMIACKKGHVRCVEALIEAGAADTEKTDRRGNTAFKLARSYGNHQCGVLLLAKENASKVLNIAV